MKMRMLVLLTAALIALLIINQRATAQEVVSGNLFTNPGWESGYYNQDSIPQIAVPNGWRMHWIDGQAFEGTNGIVANRPETVVWNIEDAPPHERSLFFRDGIYTLKIFKPWAPMYAAISQDVTGLEVGRKYRISAPIYVDIIEDYAGGNKIPPADPRMGFVRFGAGPTGSAWLNASQITYSPYWTAENVNPFYQSMPTFIWDFVASASNMTIFIEVGSRYPYPNNGFFLDTVGLFALNEVSGAAPPASNPGSGSGSSGSTAPAAPVAPAPTIAVTPREDGSIVHVVVPNDSFWSIAIQYAPALGIPADQALNQIRELNGNPQFINIGQELLIREAGNFVQGGTTATESQPTAEAGEETAATEETPESDGRTETGLETIVVEGEPLDTEVALEPAPTEQPQTPAGVCVTAFDDTNGNGQFEAGADTLKADAAITLFKDGQTVSTYITDGITDVHCFENLTSGAYQVQLFPPANFVPTTADSWAISVAEGVLIPVQFGMQFREPEAVAVADAGNTEVSEADTAVTDAPAPTPAPSSAESTTDDGGFLSNVGMVVIIAAVVLLLLAVAGIVMLRRG
ncbi:MAG TPA: LysM peptidoglycan-binding domain-containing protein [Chloroflexota bacterium]|nr:LysM peptidoglycan-binding domain-containing protein [Chloroflexota bacterium]